jgi:hypothetical protein
VAVKSVSKWRRRFAAAGLAGLEDDAPIGRPRAELVLAEGERAQLVRWARRAKTAQYLALRARIVLACAEGGTNKQVDEYGDEEQQGGQQGVYGADDATPGFGPSGESRRFGATAFIWGPTLADARASRFRRRPRLVHGSRCA